MNKEKLVLSLRFFEKYFFFVHDKGIIINGDATFLFRDINIRKNGNFNIILDKNLTSEKLIININALEHITSTIFFEYNQNNCKNIEINIHAKEYAQLFFNFFIHDTNQIKKFISAYPEEYSHISVFGSYVAKATQKINLETYQYHTVKNSSSEVKIHGIAAGNSVINHVGYLEIKKEAINTKAHQTSKHITLAKTAKIYAKPILNVLNNKVQCSHASAVGQFTDEQLFYFFARGICKNDAMKLLLESFIHHKFLSYDLQKL